jgi:hypothetical protein
VKMRSIRRFSKEEGDKQGDDGGRELTRARRGWQVLQRVKADTEPILQQWNRSRGRPPEVTLAPRWREPVTRGWASPRHAL